MKQGGSEVLAGARKGSSPTCAGGEQWGQTPHLGSMREGPANSNDINLTDVSE